MRIFTAAVLILAVSSSTSYAQNYGDLRLVPGTVQNGFAAGRLEIYINGTWGTICNDGYALFLSTAANVACKQLGYNKHSSYGTVHSEGYPEASSSVPIWLYGDIKCYSSDNYKSLLSCDHSPIGSGINFCTHSFDITLNCSTCDRFLCTDGTCVTACDGTPQCPGGEDEDQLSCILVGGISNVVKIIIAVVAVVLVLIIVIPIVCSVICCCFGLACFRKSTHTHTHSSTYQPMGVVTNHHMVHEPIMVKCDT